MKSALMFGVITAVTVLSGCAGTGSKPLTAEGLFEQHVDKAFGDDGMASPSSLVMSGMLIVEDFGVEGPFTMKQMAPANIRTTGEIMGMALDSGCNVDICWDQQPGQSPQAVSGAQKDFMLANADFTRWENIDKHYQTLELVPADDESATENYKVRAVATNGKEDFYYFSKESGLMTGASLNAETAQGPMSILTRFNNYKEFDGNLVATEIVQETPMATVKLQIEDVTYEPLATTDFEAPAGVR